MVQQPALFVSHGSPMWAIAPGKAGPALMGWATQRPKPQAILVVSPHWMTAGEVRVMSHSKPATWHDFSGFPPALYELSYPAPGAPELAHAVLSALEPVVTQMGWCIHLDAQRPLDHGAWVPLRYLYPEADVPVFQVSLNTTAKPSELFGVGRQLQALREQGVMILATGSMTHNLVERNQAGADLTYVQAFPSWVRTKLEAADQAAVLDWAAQAPHATQAHPTDEHFLPLFIAMGAAHPHEHPQWITDDVQFDFLAMDAIAWGA